MRRLSCYIQTIFCDISESFHERDKVRDIFLLLCKHYLHHCTLNSNINGKWFEVSLGRKGRVRGNTLQE